MVTAVCVCCAVVVGLLAVEVGHSAAASTSSGQSSVSTATAGSGLSGHTTDTGHTDTGQTRDHEQTAPVNFEPDVKATGRTTAGTQSDSSDRAKVRLLRLWLGTVSVVTLAALGLVGNVVAVVVWSKETSFKVTDFLFQFLAVWDSIYLLSAATSMCALYSSSILKEVLYPVANFAQLSSVHITLVITITRWIAVTRPLHAAHLLTKTRIYLSCGLVLIYCGILETTLALFDRNQPSVFVAGRVIGLAIPLLILVIFNLSLLRNARREPNELRMVKMHERQCLKHGVSKGQCLPPSHQTVTGAGKAGTSPGEITSAEPCMNLQTHNGHQGHQQHQNQRIKQTHPCTSGAKEPNCDCRDDQQQRQKKQMVKAVLLISLCVFIAYPVGASIQAYAYARRDHLDGSVSLILGIVPLLLHIINSGINVVIYFLTVARFRKLAKLRRQQLCSCKRTVGSPNNV